MKRPLIPEDFRFMMIHAPDSLTSKIGELNLAWYKFIREIKRYYTK